MNAAQFVFGLLLIALSAGLYFASSSRKAHAGQLSQAQTLDLHQAAQGRFYGKFQGSIVADQQLTTPYSARSAVAWSAHLERGTEESDEDGTTTKWQTVWSQSATTPFRLKGAGELWFDERGGMPNLDGLRPLTSTSTTSRTQSLRPTSPPAIACSVVCPSRTFTPSRHRSPLAARHSSSAPSKGSTRSGSRAQPRARNTAS